MNQAICRANDSNFERLDTGVFEQRCKQLRLVSLVIFVEAVVYFVLLGI